MKVVVIGAGTMGRGIAQAFAQCGEVEKVYLCDIKQEFADNGKNMVKKALDKRVAKGKMAQEDADAIVNKIVTGLKSWTSRRAHSRICRKTSSRMKTASLLPILLLCLLQKSVLV